MTLISANNYQPANVPTRGHTELLTLQSAPPTVLCNDTILCCCFRYGDLEHLADSCGMDGFLVVPLACAGQDQGALLVTSRAPVLMDRHMRKLASDLGHALSQTLYTLSCIGQMRAGEQILHDMLPEQVSGIARAFIASMRTSHIKSTAWAFLSSKS
jgi:hypothetical protein